MKKAALLYLTLAWFNSSIACKPAAPEAHLAISLTPQVVLKPFSIEYAAQKYGITLATANISLLSENNNNLWRHQTTAMPDGLFSLSSSTATEYALIKLERGTIRPLHYYQIKGSGKEANRIETEYNQETKIATTKNGSATFNTAFDHDYYDTQSFQAALIADLQKGFTQKNYKLIDEGEIKHYDVRYEGEEILDTSAGKYKTLKVSQKHGNRETISWHAPALNYAAVQIKNFRKGKLYTSMVIKKVIEPSD